MLRVARQLPALEHGIIELQEYPDNERVDLMMCVFVKELQDSFFEGNSPIKRNAFLNNLGEHFDAFLQEWNSEGTYLNTLLQNIYLVYDFEDRSDELPIPWRYLAFKKVSFDKDLWMTIFLKSMETFGIKKEENTLQLLRSCMENLTSNSWIFGYGFLNSRGQNLLRIGIAGFLSVQEIAEFLKKIKWTGDIDHLSSLLSFSDEYTEDYVLALDLGETISNCIGIECNVGKNENARKTKAFLDQINTVFSFDEERGRQIVNWTGNETFLEEDEKAVHCKKWLNHVKFTYDSNKVSKIKPYLYFEFKK
jgi:hypothetical protein